MLLDCTYILTGILLRYIIHRLSYMIIEMYINIRDTFCTKIFLYSIGLNEGFAGKYYKSRLLISDDQAKDNNS